MSSEQPKGAHGVGFATVTHDGRTLDVLYPWPRLGEDPRLAEEAGLSSAGSARISEDLAVELLGPDCAGVIGHDPARGVTVVAVASLITDLAAPPLDAADVYLRLHLLSSRQVRPRTINLDGVFGLLANVAWTSQGPVAAEDIDRVRPHMRARGPVTVFGVDKFPRMVDYVLPSGVRIADADRVRLGAHLAEGTTVMHEGFVNFNAGTLGASMVEGRISAGVVIGDGSDLGGGASIMGTLSGGGEQVVSVGERCLIGANAGIGISLGDDCVVEAGCYVTAGTKVTLPDGVITKARDLSGRPGLLFRRNSVSGAIEAIPRTGTWGGLNADLHAND